MVSGKLIILFALIATSWAAYNEFVMCLLERNANINISDDLFHMKPKNLTVDLDEINNWRTQICTETVLPKTFAFSRIMSSCFEEHGYQSDVLMQEKKISGRYEHFCKKPLEEAICDDLFNANTTLFTLESFQGQYCGIHLALNSFYKELYVNCTYKQQQALHKAEYFVYDLFLAELRKDEEAEYTSLDTCIESTKPIVYDESEYYSCVFNCSKNSINKREHSTTNTKPYSVANHCQNSLYENKHTCIRKCLDFAPDLADKTLLEADAVHEICNDDTNAVHKCRLASEFKKGISKCEDIAMVKSKMIPCFGEETVNILINDVLYQSADFDMFMELKECSNPKSSFF